MAAFCFFFGGCCWFCDCLCGACCALPPLALFVPAPGVLARRLARPFSSQGLDFLRVILSARDPGPLRSDVIGR